MVLAALQRAVSTATATHVVQYQEERRQYRFSAMAQGPRVRPSKPQAPRRAIKHSKARSRPPCCCLLLLAALGGGVQAGAQWLPCSPPFHPAASSCPSPSRCPFPPSTPGHDWLTGEALQQIAARKGVSSHLGGSKMGAWRGRRRRRRRSAGQRAQRAPAPGVTRRPALFCAL